MAKLDRLGWAAGISFRVCGLHLGVRVNDQKHLSRVVERLPPGWKPSESPYVEMLFSVFAGSEKQRSGLRRFSLVYADADRIARTLDFDSALESLETGLDYYVSAEARNRVFLHTGAAAWNGKVVLIAGERNTGKTTLLAELVRQGASYYSDAHTVLDVKGRVHPYPKPLGIYSEAAEKKIRTSISELGGKAGTKPLPVSLVVISEYREGARWRARQVSPGRGLLSLLTHTVPIRHRPEAALTTLQRAVAGARVLKSVRGEAKDTARSILKEMDSL